MAVPARCVTGLAGAGKLCSRRHRETWPGGDPRSLIHHGSVHVRTHRDWPRAVWKFPFHIRYEFNANPRRVGNGDEAADLLGQSGREVVAKQLLATVEVRRPRWIFLDR